jgi:hypothetical protein
VDELEPPPQPASVSVVRSKASPGRCARVAISDTVARLVAGGEMDDSPPGGRHA